MKPAGQRPTAGGVRTGQRDVVGVRRAGGDCNLGPILMRRRSAVAEKLLHRQSDVIGDLAQKRRGDVAPLMCRDRRTAAFGITELLMGAALADHLKAQLPEDVCHLRWLENRG